MRTTVRTDFFASPTPRLFAHRGDSGNYPENTLEAFQSASALGSPYLELDIHTTRDGAIVVIHDDDLRRVAGQNGVIGELSLAEVQAADAGYAFSPDGVSFPFRGKGSRIPTLHEVLAAFRQYFFIIEIKQIKPSLVPSMVAMITAQGMERRVLIASEHQAPLDEVRTLAPSLPTNFSEREVGAFMLSLPPDAPLYVPPGEALQIPPEHLGWQLVTPASVAAAHRLGVEVHVWTVNETAAMRDLLALGVDGIISDYPARLLDLLRPLSR